MGNHVVYRKPNPDAVLGYTAVTVNEDNPLPVTVVPEGGLPVSDPGGGGGGGAVDSVNGQTGTVVLDAEDVGAVPIRTSTGSWVYRHTGHSQSQVRLSDVPLAAAVVQYSLGGVVQVGEPAGNNHATTKGYVDSNFMQVVAHGTNASMARPAGAVAVYWKGSVEPINATDDDLRIGGN